VTTPAFDELLARLVAADVRFVVVGGLAVGAWGVVRGTEDVDIVPAPDRDNLDRLIGVLEDLGGRVEVEGRLLASESTATPIRAGDRALVRSELGTLDVLQGLPQLPRFADLELDAEQAEVVGVRVLVCSLGQLREMKRLAGRPRDLADLADLDAAHPDESAGD
jgi:hypothetical protein